MQAAERSVEASDRGRQRGASLVELLLVLPGFFAVLCAVWWCLLAGVQQMVGLYATFMAVRAASVAHAAPQQMMLRQIVAIDPRGAAILQRIRQVRLLHLEQQPIRTTVGGDNPLAPAPEAPW